MMRKAPVSARGFTLVEMMVTVAVAAILATIAVPSFNGVMERFRARRATETLAATMYLAKSEAAKRNQSVSVVFTKNTDGTTWCYGLSASTTCDCNTTTTSACTLGDVGTVVKSTQFKGINMTNPTALTTAVTFTPTRGTVPAGNVEFTSSGQGYKSRVVRSGIGRITTCSPATGYFGGFPSC